VLRPTVEYLILLVVDIDHMVGLFTFMNEIVATKSGHIVSVKSGIT
jgi:hypothetical protein